MVSIISKSWYDCPLLGDSPNTFYASHNEITPYRILIVLIFYSFNMSKFYISVFIKASKGEIVVHYHFDLTISPHFHKAKISHNIDELN